MSQEEIDEFIQYKKNQLEVSKLIRRLNQLNYELNKYEEKNNIRRKS